MGRYIEQLKKDYNYKFTFLVHPSFPTAMKYTHLHGSALVWLLGSLATLVHVRWS